jgi:hypothetical protein
MTITETPAPKAPAHKQAASLVPQISKAYEQLVEIESDGFTSALNKAIELGVLLNLAKEAVYAGHFWAWFAEPEHGFAFSERMARRYMRLARDREDIEKALADRPRVARMAGEGKLSIRAAEALLAPESSAPESDDDSGSDSSDSGEDDSADEGDAAKSDVEKLHDLIHKMSIDDIVATVVETIGPGAKHIADGITQRLAA